MSTFHLKQSQKNIKNTWTPESEAIGTHFVTIEDLHGGYISSQAFIQFTVKVTDVQIKSL